MAKRTFVRQLKGIDGGLESLIDEMLNHEEFHDLYADKLATNEGRSAKKLTNSMHKLRNEWLETLMGGTGLPLGEGVDLPIAKRLKDDALRPQREPLGGMASFSGDSDMDLDGAPVDNGDDSNVDFGVDYPNQDNENDDVYPAHGRLDLQQPPEEDGSDAVSSPELAGMTGLYKTTSNRPTPNGMPSLGDSKLIPMPKKMFGFNYLIKEMKRYPYMQDAWNESIGNVVPGFGGGYS